MSEQVSILLVDDEPAVLAAINAILRGDDVTTAPSGAAALDLLRSSGPFGIILTDMAMPGMSGVEFLHKARAVSPWSVRMLLTGQADLETATDAVNKGNVFRFLTKPCQPAKLRAAFKDAAAEFRRLDKLRKELLVDRERIAARMLKTQRLALLGRLAQQQAVKLLDSAAKFDELLHGTIATAESGGWVSVEELEELGRLSTVVHHTVANAARSDVTKVKPQEVDLRKVVAAALGRAHAMTGISGEFHVERSSELPSVWASPAALEDALADLALNSLEATVPGNPYRVEVSFSNDEPRRVVCEIMDNGSGIHAEIQPYVFRPFFSTKGPDRSGLGLTVAQRFIEAAGGEISFESEPQRTTFRVVLPAYWPSADTTESGH